jgi:hypothetical protein
MGCALKGSVVASALLMTVGIGVFACAKSNSNSGWGSQGSGGGSSGGGSGGGPGGPILGTGTPGGGNGSGLGGYDASTPTSSGGGGTTSGGGSGQLVPAMGSIGASDCGGCTFPPANAMPCASSAPPITILYPADNVLLPPNMNVISVHFTPFGGPYQHYSVDFTNGNNTDWHIVTACANQTVDVQANNPSGGCEVVVDPVSWSKLVGAARGQGPITVTVRGTTDNTCATASTNQVHISFAEADLLGTYYYWQSLINMGGSQMGGPGNGCLTTGVGGYIWKQTFGDLTGGETNVTPCPQTLNAGCNGCHSLSRDGTRMVVYSDDNDSDDEYMDVAGSYLDMTQNPATEFAGGITNGGVLGGGQPPGFSTINPNVTSLTSANSPGYYITSNGSACQLTQGADGGLLGGLLGGLTGGLTGCAGGYPSAVPTNGFSVWNGTDGSFIGGVTVGDSNSRPTMPDWSPDGSSVVFVVPAGEFTNWKQDDAHIYGGTLWTVPYTGNGTFGTPKVFLQSNGENNYYPSYSPDVNPTSFIIFNRVDATGQNGNCSNGFCTDDSFSNPAARLMLVASGGGTPIDLENANASPVTNKVPLSNSYPRWAPFVQTYKGNKLLWFTFSSTRDYGLRILNHKSGMYQCYPADAAETPGSMHGQAFAPQCQEPQLWMAPLYFSEGAQANKDPSGPAFWIPYQKIDSHNHTAQWTQQHVQPPPPPGQPPPMCSCQSMVYGNCGVANGGCDCCAGSGLTCSGSNTCFSPAK